MNLIIPLLCEKKKRKKPKLVGLGLHGLHTTAINPGSTNFYFCFSTVKKMIMLLSAPWTITAVWGWGNGQIYLA